MPAGGGARKILYRVKQSDHSAIIAKDTTDESGATPVASPTESHAALILADNASLEQIVESSGIKFDDNGVMTATYGQTNASDTVWDFLAIAAPKTNAAGTATRTEKTSEAGVKIGGASGSGQPAYLLIDKGAPDTTGAILTTMSIVTVKKSSGSRDYKANEFVSPSIEVVSTPCNKSGGYAIPQGCFSGSHWGTISAGDRTIPENGYEKTAMLPAP